MAGVLLKNRLPLKCMMWESYWRTSASAALGSGASSRKTCKVYDLKQSGHASRTAGGTRSVFTVVNKSDSDCVFDDFPSLTAIWRQDRHELTSTQHPQGPVLVLPPGAKATSYLQTGKSCARTALEDVEVEGVKLSLAKGVPLSVPNCSLTRRTGRSSPEAVGEQPRGPP